jgi:WhiB family transcriptional regulator, redox-sensing transcriptional regulator
VTPAPPPAAPPVLHLSAAQAPSDGNWNRNEWRHLAACATADTQLFFPAGVGSRAAADIARAKSLCSACPVQGPCLEFALRTLQDYGVWGGKDEEERRDIRRARRAAVRRTQHAAAAVHAAAHTAAAHDAAHTQAS